MFSGAVFTFQMRKVRPLRPFLKKQISSTFTILITSNGNNNVLRNALYSQLYLMRYITETLLYIFPVMPLEAIYIFEILQEMDACALSWGLHYERHQDRYCIFYNPNAF